MTRAHPQVALALGNIQSSPAEAGALQLLNDDSLALWPKTTEASSGRAATCQRRPGPASVADISSSAT